MNLKLGAKAQMSYFNTTTQFPSEQENQNLPGLKKKKVFFRLKVSLVIIRSQFKHPLAA